jgi:tetratricopeptide (TPR) repeat protein
VNPERFTARWLFGRAFEIDSRSLQLLHSWANAEARAGNLGSIANPEAFTARWLFHRITSLAPRDIEAWTSWAICERRANNIGEEDESDEGTARWIFAKALAIRENVETLTAAADMEQHDCRNIARAEKYYLRAAAATRNEKTRARILFDLGMAFSRMSENDKAVTYLTKAVDVFPNDHIIHAKLGRSHGFLRNNALAEFHFRRALEIKPSDTKTQLWYQDFLRATRHEPERPRV